MVLLLDLILYATASGGGFAAIFPAVLVAEWEKL